MSNPTAAEKAAQQIAGLVSEPRPMARPFLAGVFLPIVQATIDERTKPLVEALRLARRTFARLNFADSVGGVLYIIDAALAAVEESKGGDADG